MNQTNKSRFRSSLGRITEETGATKKTKVDQEEEDVFACLQTITKSSAIQYLDFSDCGLTQSIIMRLVEDLDESHSLLSLHLSGNPGLIDPVIEDI